MIYAELKNRVRLSESLEMILSGEAFKDSQFFSSINPPLLKIAAIKEFNAARIWLSDRITFK